MAVVLLKNDWFAPNGARYRKGRVEVPANLVPLLPSSAEPAEGAAKPAAGTLSLKDHDPLRAAGDAEDVAAAEAEKERLANAARIKAALDREKGKK